MLNTLCFMLYFLVRMYSPCNTDPNMVQQISELKVEILMLKDLTGNLMDDEGEEEREEEVGIESE